MLTYQQFVQKHATKYSRLSPAEKRKRYGDYVRVNGATNPPTNSNTRRSGRPNRSARRAALRGASNSSANNPFVANQGALQRYLKLFASPFDADTVGLPVFPSPPSAKVTSWARGTFSTGTLGCGFVLGCPHAASDAATWRTTSSAFTGSGFAISGTTGVSSFACQNLPFAASSFTEATGIRQRLVCAAVRIRYIGTETDRSGLICPFIHPNHGSINGFGRQQLSGFEETWASIPVTKDWTTIVWSPIHRAELDYSHVTIVPNHANPEAIGEDHMGILIDGTKASAPFEVEIIQHHEFLGVGGAMSKSENGVLFSADPYISRLQSPQFSLRGVGNAAAGAVRAALTVGNLLGEIGVIPSLRGSAVRRAIQDVGAL